MEIYLHTFEYGRGQQESLSKYCKNIYYYERNSFLKSFLSKDPFIVKSRSNTALIARLNKDTYPVLFEGLHTTYPVYEDLLKDKLIFIRAHNIEHRFYRGLSQSESNLFKKRFFKQEAKKLKKYQDVLKKANGVFTISPFEQDYFLRKIGQNSHYIPAFHNPKPKQSLGKKGTCILYHGNIGVSENVKAVEFLIDTYKNTEYQLVISSSFENTSLSKEIGTHDNISFVKIKSDADLTRLFTEAHIHVLPTFQKTGIKLKLLNTLYQGRFIIANDFMIEDTGLESLCERANTPKEFLEKTSYLYSQDFTEQMMKKRQEVLESFSPEKSAKKLVQIIFS